MSIFALAIVEQAGPLVEMILNRTSDRRILHKQKDINNNSPLHLAVLVDSEEIVEKLIQYEFSKSAINKVIHKTP